MNNVMKDSRITSIGLIPEEWNIVRVKNVFERRREINTKESPNILMLSREAIKERDISSNVGQIATSYDNYHVVHKGDLLLNPMDLISGANCNVSELEGVISPAYINLHAKEKNNSSYYNYYFKHQYWSFEMFSNGKGVSFENRWTINNGSIMNYKIILPNEEKQNEIVEFLDKKIALIDLQIDKNKKAIDLINEYRDSLIDIYVKPKEDWKKEKLKYSFEFSKGLSITKEDLVLEGIPVISYGQIHSKENNGTTIKDSLFRYVPNIYLQNNNSSLVKKGDFIFADTSEDLDGVGNCVYVDKEITLFAGYHTVILKSKVKDNRFYSYLFKSSAWRSQIRSRVFGIKLFSITQNILKQVDIIIPLKEEQKEIADYLDKKCYLIDKVIDNRKKIIEKLEEYRKSLIYEAVTGKIEV